MKVRECMSRGVRLCSPNDRLVGMVTDRDIVVRIVADGKGPDTPVREAMTREIHYVFEDEDLESASAKMSRLKVRRLPVLNRAKRMVGILSLGDVWGSEESARAASALRDVVQPSGPHRQA